MAMAAKSEASGHSSRHGGRDRAGGGLKMLRDLWEWLTGPRYRPERHYMRGARRDEARAAAAPR
jgi:hypothetical protein